ncbi:MAG: DUF4157 domain-containing protein [Anaerolineales bacterium]
MSEFARNQNRTVDNSLLRPAQPERTAAEPAHKLNPQPFGNQAARKFSESCPRALPSPGLCPFGGACHACPARVQTKLEISQPDDPYEQEADRVADQAMAMPEPKVQRACPSCEEDTLQKKPLADQITPLVQRQEEPEEEEPVQAKPAPEAVQRQEEPGEEEEEPVQGKAEEGAVQRREKPEEEEEPVQGKAVNDSIQRQEEPEEEEAIQAMPAEGSMHRQTESASSTMRREHEPPLKEQEASKEAPEAAEEKEKPEPVMAKQFDGGSPHLPHDFERQLHSLSGGSPLPVDSRQFFEQRFGSDFGDVRVHAGLQASEAAKSVHAQAFTIGREIVFGQNRYAPDSQSGKRLLSHELTHIIQQRGAGGKVQRTPNVELRSNPGARGCLVHLHGRGRADPGEGFSWEVANRMFGEYCVNFVYIDHTSRLIDVDVPGASPSLTCRADPNRIFTDAGINSAQGYDNHNSGRCLVEPEKSAAQAAIRAFRDQTLNPKIRQCRGQAVSQGQTAGTGVEGAFPLAAFHNNTPGAPLTIESYILPGGSESAATETNTARTRGICNPHIATGRGNNIDNFYLVTNPDDFCNLVLHNRNVVLQKENPPNDGSLSVTPGVGRFVNTEAQRDPANLPENQRLGNQAMETLGIPRQPCTPQASPATGGNACPWPSLTPAASGAAITSANLSPVSDSTQNAFKRRVYDLQVGMFTSHGTPYTGTSVVETLPASDSRTGRIIELRPAVIPFVQSLLTAARRALAEAQRAGDTRARGVTDLAILSGYRSARGQLSLWDRRYDQYRGETRECRSRIQGGEYSDTAAQYLAMYINQRLHPAGYSQHQQGMTIDVTYRRNGAWAEADTSVAGVQSWEDSWFYRWLIAHAYASGFFPNPEIHEPWHWVFNPNFVAGVVLLLWRATLRY